MKLPKASFGLITMVLGLLVCGVYINSKTDQSSFADKFAYVFFSTVSVPNSIQRLFSRFTVPSFDFNDEIVDKPLPYGDLNFWASHPEKVDGADVSPLGFNFDRQETAEVDVFFVHPTTYVSSDSWNQTLNKQDILIKNRPIRYLQEWSLRDQASIFNSCCKVYAPHYRQATLASFLSINGKGGKALDYAYKDVRAAFNYFLNNFNKDRAFVLVGHSQGAMHIIRLLKEEIAGTSLMDRMIAAYTVGYPSKPIPGLKICRSRNQTMCQISWNTQTIEAEGRLVEPNEICVNPLSWNNSNIWIEKGNNLGSISFLENKKLSVNLVGAGCVDGKLIVKEVNSKFFRYMPFGSGIYHHYDFSLFHMNIRENIEERISTFNNK